MPMTKVLSDPAGFVKSSRLSLLMAHELRRAVSDVNALNCSLLFGRPVAGLHNESLASEAFEARCKVQPG